MTDPSWSLQSFLGSLERRVQQMSSDEIRGSLLRHAQGLQGADRDEFLGIFTAPDQTALVEKSPDLTWPIEHDPLLAEIDDFVARLAAGEHFEGFGWEDEFYDERSFGDEPWVWKFDDFFAEVQDAFLSGRFGLARAAYQRLFQALTLDEDIGTFCGPEPAVEMVETDLGEAQARYLRTIYETTPAGQRASTLVERWFDLPAWSREVSLAAVRESRRQELPGFQEFLSDWMNTLRSISSPGPQVRKLLTEATQMFAGLDGLGDLARQAEHDQAEHYLQWVQALRAAERNADAVNAAGEALQVLDAVGTAQALIADELGELSGDDAAQLLYARRSAWRAAPSHARLLALHDVATATGQAAEVMSAELEELETEDALGRLAGSLHASLAILAERADELLHVLNEPTGALGRSASDVLVPYMLASGCCGPSHPDWPSSRLAEFFTTVDLNARWSGFVDLGHADDKRPTEDRPSLSQRFADQIIEQQESTEVLFNRLNAAVQMIEHEADDIVSTKDRRLYATAAQKLANSAEALTLANSAETGAGLVQKWKKRYPRHNAFQKELQAAIKRTPLLNKV